MCKISITDIYTEGNSCDKTKVSEQALKTSLILCLQIALLSLGFEISLS